MLSIVIPTKNEEIFLPKLLESIKKQNFYDYEIIVADADSTDHTKEIARKYGAQMIKGGMPAKGRNAGAEIAHGELFLILDADVVLPERFIEKALNEFQNRNLDIANIPIYPITNKEIIKLIFNYFYNIPVIVLEKIVPYGTMGILVKKSIYKKIKGYDEKIMIGEDNDFIRRAAKISKSGVLRNVNIFVSLRRFYQDGWLKTVATYVAADLYSNVIGPFRSDFFKYRFAHYSKEIKE